MKVEVAVNAITIEDENSGKKRTIKTTREVDEIADYILEQEKDIIRDKVEEAVSEALNE